MNRSKRTSERWLRALPPLVEPPVSGGVEWDDIEPSPTALAAIEAEWPLIAAELDVVDAECAMARQARVSELDRRRLRRARERVVREVAALAARGMAVSVDVVAGAA